MLNLFDDGYLTRVQWKAAHHLPYHRSSQADNQPVSLHFGILRVKTLERIRKASADEEKLN